MSRSYTANESTNLIWKHSRKIPNSLMNLPKMKKLILGSLIFKILVVSLVGAEIPMRIISDALDDAQDVIDEYGTLHVSAPVLTYAKSNDFRFALKYGASNYFNDAKTSVQGKAAGFEQFFHSFMFQGRGEMDPTVMAAYAQSLIDYQQRALFRSTQHQARYKAAQLDLDAALERASALTSLGESNEAVANALREFANTIDMTNSLVHFPTSEGIAENMPAAPTNMFGLVTNTNLSRIFGILPFMALNVNQLQDLKIPNRSAVITAAGDNAVEAIFRTLGDSSIEGNFANKEKFFGLSMISIDPGWRTQKEWAGEVLIFAELEFRPARSEVVRRIVDYKTNWPDAVVARIAQDYGINVSNIHTMENSGISPSRLHALNTTATQKAKLDDVISKFSETVPSYLQLKTDNKPVSVTIVSPVTDNETFDLASSYRKQSEFALALSFALRYAGAKGEASAFEKFAKSRQFDISSRTPLAAVNAFSGQGGVFGFQIGPRLRALKNPGSKQSGSGKVLERQTFPALILVGMSSGDIEPRLDLSKKNGKQQQIVVYEPYITLRQMRRWVPMKRKFFSGRDWYRPKDWFHPKLSEKERLKVVSGLEMARSNVSKLGWSATSFGWTNDPGATLYQRLDYFEEQLIGSLDRITLPAERIVPELAPRRSLRVAKITNIYPNSVTLPRDQHGKIGSLDVTLLLQGQDLDTLIPSTARFIPTNATIRTTMGSKSVIVIQAKVEYTNLPMVLAFDLNTNKAPAGSLLSPPIQIQAPPNTSHLPQVEIVSPKAIELTHDSEGKLIARTNKFVMLGMGLTSVDISSVGMATGNARLRQIQGIGDGLVIELIITNANEAISLRLPIKDQVGNAILSKPINVSIAAQQSGNSPTD